MGKGAMERKTTGQEPVDDRYRQLQKEICLRDESMVVMTAKVDPLRHSFKQHLEASNAGGINIAKPQLESAYNLMALLALP